MSENAADKPESNREVAENNLELAKALAGQSPLGDQDFLERMARSDRRSRTARTRFAA